MHSQRYPVIEAEVKTILQYLSGHSLKDVNTSASFFDLGFDSLLLTQASQSFRQKFGVKVTFRQLMEELLSIDAVTAYLDEKVAPDKFTAAPAPQATPVAVPRPEKVVAQAAVTLQPSVSFASAGGLDLTDRADRLIKQQLQIMAEQVELMPLCLKIGRLVPSLSRMVRDRTRLLLHRGKKPRPFRRHRLRLVILDPTSPSIAVPAAA
jgi:acyl carrier protein